MKIFIAVIIGLIVGWLITVAVQVRADSIRIGAKVPVTTGNCMKAYNDHQECIDKCIY